MWKAEVLTSLGSLRCHTQAVSRYQSVHMCSTHLITQMPYTYVYADSFSGDLSVWQPMRNRISVTELRPSSLSGLCHQSSSLSLHSASRLGGFPAAFALLSLPGAVCTGSLHFTSGSPAMPGLSTALGALQSPAATPASCQHLMSVWNWSPPGSLAAQTALSPRLCGHASHNIGDCKGQT